MNEKMVACVRDRMESHNRKRHGKLTFSVEYGRGETYANSRVTLYALDNYERSSVLYGRERRCWVGEFESVADARETLRECKAERITDWQIDEDGLGAGSSHVPIDQIVSHLPDDTDY